MGSLQLQEVVSARHIVKPLSRDLLRRIAIPALALATAFGCDHANTVDKISFYDRNLPQPVQYEPQRQLKALIARDPVKDADAAYRRGDKRFVGIRANSIVIPGVAMTKELDAAVQKNGTKIVCGTTDYSQTELQSEICEKAAVYASHYNRRLLENLGKAKLTP